MSVCHCYSATGCDGMSCYNQQYLARKSNLNLVELRRKRKNSDVCRSLLTVLGASMYTIYTVPASARTAKSETTLGTSGVTISGISDRKALTQTQYTLHVAAIYSKICNTKKDTRECTLYTEVAETSRLKGNLYDHDIVWLLIALHTFFRFFLGGIALHTSI